MSSAPAATAVHRDQMILRAERRRGLLERMSDAGTKAAERLAHRAWAPEVGDEAARNGLAFAKVSRAVRLTLMLEARIDDYILALCNGLTPTAVAWLEPGAVSERRPLAASVPPKDAEVQDHETVESLAGDGEASVEREFERLPSGGFKACVAEICDGLGIVPDWSCWSDQEGFVHDDGRPVTDFTAWSRSPSPDVGRVDSGVSPSGVGETAFAHHPDRMDATSPPRSAARSRPSP